jgi:multidrug efflux pump subunit AcrA (membrane-fusion protein)
MKRIILLLVVLLAGAGGMWLLKSHSPAPAPTPATADRKILYYQSAMHPWIKSDKPGKCPICGMNLVPIYEGESGMDTNMTPGTVRLNASSVSVINVQSETITNQPLVRTLHFGGQIMANSSQQAWFEFTVYERDLPWLKIGQTLHITVPSVPDKTFTAKIKLHGGKSFADEDFDNMTGSIKLRAELSESPVEAGELGSHKYFSGLYAESHVVAETEPVLTVPRSAVISRGSGPVVFLDKGDGHYTPRAVLLGRTGDEFYEVLAGLDAGDKVVTNGNLLIDSEAQLAAGL